MLNRQLTEIHVNSYPYCWGGVFSKSPNSLYIYKYIKDFEKTCAYLCITSEHFSGAWKPAEMCRFQSTPLGANTWADSAFPNRKPPGGTPHVQEVSVMFQVEFFKRKRNHVIEFS